MFKTLFARPLALSRKCFYQEVRGSIAVKLMRLARGKSQWSSIRMKHSPLKAGKKVMFATASSKGNQPAGVTRSSTVVARAPVFSGGSHHQR